MIKSKNINYKLTILKLKAINHFCANSIQLYEEQIKTMSKILGFFKCWKN